MATFADEMSKLFGDAGFTPGDDGPIPPDGVARRVHGDVSTMMIGGYAALLLQMLHPGPLAGVWDHSQFRRDMHGRLQRTAQFVAVTTYGGRADAEAACARVRRIHGHVRGVLPEGMPYSANDPDLLAFVHVAETWCFLRAWVRYREPAMPAAEQDRYFAEMAAVAALLGSADVPTTKAAADAYLQAVRPRLRFDGRTREVQRFLLAQPARSLAGIPFLAVAREAGIDLLPAWAKAMHGLGSRTRPVVRASAGAMTRGLNWLMRRQQARAAAA